MILHSCSSSTSFFLCPPGVLLLRLRTIPPSSVWLWVWRRSPGSSSGRSLRRQRPRRPPPRRLCSGRRRRRSRAPCGPSRSPSGGRSDQRPSRGRASSRVGRGRPRVGDSPRELDGQKHTPFKWRSTTSTAVHRNFYPVPPHLRLTLLALATSILTSISGDSAIWTWTSLCTQSFSYRRLSLNR